MFKYYLHTWINLTAGFPSSLEAPLPILELCFARCSKENGSNVIVLQLSSQVSSTVSCKKEGMDALHILKN